LLDLVCICDFPFRDDSGTRRSGSRLSGINGGGFPHDFRAYVFVGAIAVEWRMVGERGGGGFDLLRGLHPSQE